MSKSETEQGRPLPEQSPSDFFALLNSLGLAYLNMLKPDPQKIWLEQMKEKSEKKRRQRPSKLHLTDS